MPLTSGHSKLARSHSRLCVSPRWWLQVIADLEEEKRRHAEDTAEGDDVTYILEKEKERLQQQVSAKERKSDQKEILSFQRYICISAETTPASLCCVCKTTANN